MLNIWYCGGNVEVLTDAPRYFDNVWEDEWLEDPLVKQMIKDVDNSEVISPHLIESPVLGPIGPKDISGGVKVLILLLKDTSFIYNISNCGDNCAKWIIEIAKIYEKEQNSDLTVFLEHIMDFGTCQPLDIDFKIMNSNKIVKNTVDYVDEVIKAEYLVEDGIVPEAEFIWPVFRFSTFYFGPALYAKQCFSQEFCEAALI